MGLRKWLGRGMTFVPPELEEDEWERYDDPTFDRNTGEWRSGLRRISMKPLEWSAAPPTRAGWWYVRRRWDTEYEAVRVLPGYDYPGGEFLWCGPLPEPVP